MALYFSEKFLESFSYFSENLVAADLVRQAILLQAVVAASSSSFSWLGFLRSSSAPASVGGGSNA